MSRRGAEPGGLCISRVVREQIRDKLAYAIEDLGEQSVKNIARPVRVYALRSAAVAALPAPTVQAALPISRPAVAPRLSIVVLPFTNLGNDPEQQYFADGITEDLTTELSRLAGMSVTRVIRRSPIRASVSTRNGSAVSSVYAMSWKGVSAVRVTRSALMSS